MNYELAKKLKDAGFPQKMEINKIYKGDSFEVLKTFPDESIDCCITSPPYWGLRDYGVDGQLGLEKTPEEFVAKMVDVFREVRRVLKKEGTLWLNLGDSYVGGGFGTGVDEDYDMGKQGTNRGTSNFEDRKKLGTVKKKIPGLKSKDLVGIPWMVAFALRTDSWYFRQDIIWAKPNPMPESVTDRCTKSHEYIFLMAKSQKYYYNADAIKESAVWDIDGTGTIVRKERQREGLKSNPDKMKNGIRITYPNGKHKDGQQSPKFINGFRNKRSVWTIATKGYPEAHFATYPQDLIAPMILAGCPENGIILDPFMGAGTTGLVAQKLGRNYVGVELNGDYIKIAEERLKNKPLFTDLPIANL